MAPRFLRKLQPRLDAFRTHPLVVRYGAWLTHPALWHLSRRSVPGAFAIGLFAGLIPGPLQMLAALLLAVPLRKNIPVALVTTFYTNPFTIVPLWVLAYTYGHFLLGSSAPDVHIDPLHMHWSEPAFAVHIDPKKAAQLVSSRMMLPLILLPLFGIAVALALTGYLIAGILLFVAAIGFRYLVRRTSRNFVLLRSLDDSRFYENAVAAGVLVIQSP